MERERSCEEHLPHTLRHRGVKKLELCPVHEVWACSRPTNVVPWAELEEILSWEKQKSPADRKAVGILVGLRKQISKVKQNPGVEDERTATFDIPAVVRDK